MSSRVILQESKLILHPKTDNFHTVILWGKKSLLQAKLKEFWHFKQFYPELEQLGYFIILLPVGLFCQICLSLVSCARRFYFGPVDSITQCQSFMDNYSMPNAVNDCDTQGTTWLPARPRCLTAKLLSYLRDNKSTLRKASRISLLQALSWYCQSQCWDWSKAERCPERRKYTTKAKSVFTEE